MKHTLFLLLASGLVLTACKKPAAESSTGSGQPVNQSGGDLAELMKTPDAAKMLESWVYSKRRCFPEESFEIATPKVVVKRVDKDHFEIYAEHNATPKSDLYSVSSPLVITGDDGVITCSVIELRDRKGTKKTRYYQCMVRYGPINSGRNPEKIMWNWENPKETGDDMAIYEGPSLCWATAEGAKINSEGTASSVPGVFIRDTPDYLKAVEKHPELATAGEQRRKEESEYFDRLLEAMPKKSR